MDEALFETLLRRSENETLDFKVAQYTFAGPNVTDDIKSELLKDILAFANAWRESDAYILIGVQEVKGGRSTVLGIQNQLDDASLQQFVKSKTQAPIKFIYYPFPFENRMCGVIEIPVQGRPFFLTRDFGRLRHNVVYIRRGSSTDEANPDEILKMSNTTAQTSRPSFELYAQPRKVQEGNHFVLRIEVFLFNRGPGTADDIRAILLKYPTGLLGINYDSWDGRQSSHLGTTIGLRSPLNPDDHIFVFSVSFEMHTSEDSKISVGCEDLEFRVKLLARDHPSTDYSIRFDPQDIHMNGGAFS